ncbi:response regulator [Acetobacterium paludosum]|uniref:Stage 0 sporulation protein A homolog n=2 Tax=Acetobacterium paludosum TaxID=52693 RepID=A0A923HV31_9FIRM|nr:response regulator [Acetobacterium paludosum]MBC3888841.1 response regulator [Acetobacterium paludosum]
MKTILYVDDNPLDIELTLEAIKENQILNPIIVANDGLEALAYLKSEGIYAKRKPGNPCMVLLDLKMPRMDGLEFLAIVKKAENYKRIPVILLTSSREESDLIKGYNLGVNAYVVKPLDFLALIEVVKQIGIFWAIINELPSE